MPKLLAYVIESRGKARPIVLQENATPASLANLRSFKVAKVALNPVLAGNYVFGWQNPENNPILVTRVIIDVTTASGVAADMNVGVADSAITTAAGIFAAASLNAIATLDNLTALPATHLLTAHGSVADAWITGLEIGTGSCAGLVGNIYIVYQEV